MPPLPGRAAKSNSDGARPEYIRVYDSYNTHTLSLTHTLTLSHTQTHTIPETRRSITAPTPYRSPPNSSLDPDAEFGGRYPSAISERRTRMPPPAPASQTPSPPHRRRHLDSEGAM